MCSGTERGWAELVFLERGAQPPAQGLGVPGKHVVWGRCRGPSSWALTSVAHGRVTFGQITVYFPRSLSSETKLFSVQGPEGNREGDRVTVLRKNQG